MTPPEQVYRLLDKLPARLPEDYRTFLIEASAPDQQASFQPLVATQTGWETVVSGFLREWHPLIGHLFPVEHLGEGCFACLQLKYPGQDIPVVGWDIAADLGEQSCLTLASSWIEYRNRRQDGHFDPLAEMRLPQRRRAAVAERELRDALDRFDRVVQSFHDRHQHRHGAAFEHHRRNALPRDRDWKPERFAVQDHLLGVMAYRFNGRDNVLEVIGFATRDHTNFARSSATVGLLLGLLCEWAAKGAQAIRFLTDATGGNRGVQPHPMPYEVALLGWLFGADTRPNQCEISADQARTLLQVLTPFPATVQRGLARIPELGMERACLAVHRQIWSPLEASLLLRWCPQAADLFAGTVDVGEPVRLQNLLHHARAAALAGFGLRLVMVASETTNAPSPRVELLIDEPELPFAVLCHPEVESRWRRASDGNEFVIEPQRPLILIGIPEYRSSDLLQQGCGRLGRMLQAHWPGIRTLGIVPAATPVLDPIEDITLVLADQDGSLLDTELQQRLQQCRRLRS